MFKDNLKTKLVVIITFLLSGMVFINAEQKGLIFSEVHLNKKNPNNIWLEVTNTTGSKVILSKLRYSTVRSPNIMPNKIKEQGGIEIKSGKSIILCSNKTNFNQKNQTNTKVYEIKVLGKIAEGGFFALKGNSKKGNYMDAFRYGEAKYSKQYKDNFGDYVVPFSNNNESYIRKGTRNKNAGYKSSKNYPEFKKSTPTPGKYKISERKRGE